MANLLLFDSHSQYQTYAGSDDYVEPHVSYCLQEKCVQYNKIKYKFYISAVDGHAPNVHMNFLWDNDNVLSFTQHSYWLRDDSATLIEGTTYYKLFYTNDEDSYVGYVTVNEPGEYSGLTFYYIEEDEEGQEILVQHNIISLTIQAPSQVADKMILNATPNASLSYIQFDNEYNYTLYRWESMDIIYDGVTYYAYDKEPYRYSAILGPGLGPRYYLKFSEPGIYNDVEVYSGGLYIEIESATLTINAIDTKTQNVIMDYYIGDNVEYTVDFPIYNIIPFQISNQELL